MYIQKNWLIYAKYIYNINGLYKKNSPNIQLT